MAKRFKKKGCPEYNDLCFIFGDTQATGVHAHGSTKSPSDTEEEGDNFCNEVDLGADDAIPAGPKTSGFQPSTSKKNEAPIAMKKKKRGYSSIVEQALITIGEESKRKNDLLEQKLALSSSSVGDIGVDSSARNDVATMKECMKALNGLSIEGSMYGKAVKALHDSSLYREIFLDMPDERKIDWVLSL